MDIKPGAISAKNSYYNIMKTRFLVYSIITLFSFFTSCEDEVNNWDVDSSHERLFKSLVFEISNTGSTSVEIKYTKSVSTTKYVFEFSEDSLEFNDIVKTIEILADTVTPFAESTTVTKTEYRTTFSELAGTTAYSVRMKSVNDETGMESNYSELYFETSAEQIFTDYTVFTNKLELFWTPSDRLTHLIVSDAFGQELQNATLSAEAITNGTTTIEGLDPGTAYNIKIYNDTKVRGSLNLTTSGLNGGFIVDVAPSDIITDLINNALLEGNTNITLIFTGGATYDIGSLQIPFGVTNISFTGAPDAEGTMPQLNMTEVRLSDMMIGKLIFENVKIIGDLGKYFFFIGTDDIQIDEVLFKNCYVSEHRSVVRMGNNQMHVNKVGFEDCWIHRIGGYGVVNIGGSNVQLDTLSFHNSTLTELATQLMDVRTAVTQIFIGNCTFVNLNTSMSQLMRLEKPRPLSVLTENNIVAGNNGGAEVNAVNFDAASEGLNISFGGSYITNDLVINKYEFANITLFNGTTYELFVDPDNQDFSINPESGFGGRGSAGDPRWFRIN